MSRGKKVLLAALGVWACYLWGFDRSPMGKDCYKSISPDKKYYATLCFRTYERFSEVTYEDAPYNFVARLYENKTGRILAITTFNSPEPQFLWGKDYLLLQRGGVDGDGSNLDLPPSRMDRILANRPRLVQLKQTWSKYNQID